MRAVSQYRDRLPRTFPGCWQDPDFRRAYRREWMRQRRSWPDAWQPKWKVRWPEVARLALHQARLEGIAPGTPEFRRLANRLRMRAARGAQQDVSAPHAGRVRRGERACCYFCGEYARPAQPGQVRCCRRCA